MESRVTQVPVRGRMNNSSADMDSNQLEAFLTAQTKKPGGITTDHAIVIAKFWKNQRAKIHESLINQSKWENSLKNISWRVDLKTQSRHIDQMNSPVAIVEMELEKNGQMKEKKRNSEASQDIDCLQSKVTYIIQMETPA
uniref:COMM domain-containing protein 1 n=1 Tax=Laticauda laticaudata TaxID=8630 RepID=A0A8C5REF6_LATLA